MVDIPELISTLKAAVQAGQINRCLYYRDETRAHRKIFNCYKQIINFDGDVIGSCKYQCNKILRQMEEGYAVANKYNDVRNRFRVVRDDHLIIVHYVTGGEDEFTVAWLLKFDPE